MPQPARARHPLAGGRNNPCPKADLCTGRAGASGAVERPAQEARVKGRAW